MAFEPQSVNPCENLMGCPGGKMASAMRQDLPGTWDHGVWRGGGKGTAQRSEGLDHAELGPVCRGADCGADSGLFSGQEEPGEGSEPRRSVT